MKRTVVWLIGSNACGKSTQARMLMEALTGSNNYEYVKSPFKRDSELLYEYTYIKNGNFKVANLGRITNQQCSGTDTLSTKRHIMNSYNQASIDGCDVIIIDSIMATGQFMEFIRCYDVNVFLIFLDYDNPEDNYKRVQYRRGQKKNVSPESITLDEKTKLNIAGKIRGFKRLYNRMSKLSDFSLRVSATDTKQQIQNQIISKWYEHI